MASRDCEIQGKVMALRNCIASLEQESEDPRKAGRPEGFCGLFDKSASRDIFHISRRRSIHGCQCKNALLSSHDLHPMEESVLSSGIGCSSDRLEPLVQRLILKRGKFLAQDVSHSNPVWCAETKDMEKSAVKAR
jgi:hypothetical protein